MKLTNKKPDYSKLLKVLITTAVSLSLMMGVIPTNSASAFDTNDATNEARTKKIVLDIQKETKGFTDKQRVAYYNKTIDKIIKDSKKQPTKELQLLSMFLAVKERLTHSSEGIGKSTPYKKYKHKDPGVYAINAGVAGEKGYHKVMKDVFQKAGYTVIDFADRYGNKWLMLKFGNYYYHMDVYNSDFYDGNSDVGSFLMSDEEAFAGTYQYKYEPDPRYPAPDNSYKDFSMYFYPNQIIKKTSKYYYIVTNNAIVRISFTGKVKVLHSIDGFFVAKKGETFYIWDLPNDEVDEINFYKTTMSNPDKRTFIGTSYDEGWSVDNGVMKIKNKKTKKTIIIKVDKDTRFY